MLERSIRQRKLLLFTADMLTVGGVYWIAFTLRFHVDIGLWRMGETPVVEYRRLMLAVLAIWAPMYHRSNLYRPDPSATVLGILWRFARANFLATVILFALTYFLRIWEEPSRWFMGLFVALNCLLGAAVRVLLSELLGRWLRQGMSMRRVLIVGAGDAGRRLAAAISNQAAGFQIVGVLDDAATPDDEVLPDVRILGPVSQLDERLARGEADEVLVAMGELDSEAQKRCIETCMRYNVVWKIVPSLYEMLLDRVSVDEVGGVPLIGMKTSNVIGVNYLLKRGIDLAGGALLLLFCAPVMAAAALAVKIGSPGPVFYRHTRVGYKLKPFTFLKFRSMYVGADRDKEALRSRNERQGPVFKMANDPRVTPVGRFLRKYSIDELPQIFHVLAGRMSLIGPRPPLPEEVAEYEEWQKRRLDAPPGITGLWQVSGRHRLSFDEMVKLDLYYIENWSLALDLKIAVRTLLVVLSGDSA